MEKKIRTHSLIFSFKLIFIVLAVVILATFLLLIVYVQQLLLNQTEYNLKQTHQKNVETIESYLEDLEAVAFTVGYSSITQKYLQEDVLLNRILMDNEMRTLYMNTVTIMEDINGFCLYDHNGTSLLRYGDYADKYPSAFVFDSKLQYKSGKSDANHILENYLLIYPIYYVNPSRLLGEITGYVGFTVKVNRLTKILKNSTIYPESEFVLSDLEGNIIASNKTLTVFAESDTLDDDRKYINLQLNIDSVNWNLSAVMPKGVVAKEFKPVIFLMIISGIIVGMLLVVTILILYLHVIHPIHRLSQFMRTLSTNDPDARLTTTTQNEIGTMAKAMNQMLDQLHEQNEELRTSETQRITLELARQQMEILAYRNQINPHFLYNTLECIRGIAIYHQAHEIVEICQAMSRMLRYAVKGGNYVQIKEEICYIEEYSKIIKYRFDQRITIEWDIQEELDRVRIIKLCLQPIVENSVMHGLETKRSIGKILITGYMDKMNVVFIIRDNGAGMDKHTLQSLYETIEKAYQEENEYPSVEQHIGISNIARRLFLNYGSKSLIHIESTLGVGTQVTLKIPVITEDINV